MCNLKVFILHFLLQGFLPLSSHFVWFVYFVVCLQLQKVSERWHWCQSQRIILWKYRELKWCGRHEEWILNAVLQKRDRLLRLWYIANTHTHTDTHSHAWWSSTSSSLPWSMEDEKPMSAHILILKSTVFWFWFCYSRAWSGLLSASLQTEGLCVCVCSCERYFVCAIKLTKPVSLGFIFLRYLYTFFFMGCRCKNVFQQLNKPSKLIFATQKKFWT